MKKNGEEVNESNEEKVEADENESNEEKAIIKVKTKMKFCLLIKMKLQEVAKPIIKKKEIVT